VAAGAAVAFALWFVGFMVVGGEWFLMWQSSTWNGQEAAFRFYLTVLAVGAYVLLDTGEG
jgi:predicted small integral membrane protein